MSYHHRLHPRRTSSPVTRVWSHNTEYTGATGIHSEVGMGTMARNHLEERRTSHILSTEQEMMRKEMKAFHTNRKSLEKSMLQYSQKMKEIAARRSQARRSPASDPRSNRPMLRHSIAGDRYSSKSDRQFSKPNNGIRLSPTGSNDIPVDLNLNLTEIENDPLPKLPDIPSVKNRGRAESTISIDSGFSSDVNTDTVRSIQSDSIIDEHRERKSEMPSRVASENGCYKRLTEIDQSRLKFQDASSKQQFLLYHGEQDRQNSEKGQQLEDHNRRETPEENTYGHGLKNDTKTNHDRGRTKERKRLRDSKTFKLASRKEHNFTKQEVDKSEEDYSNDEEEEFETPRIVPYPYDVLYNYLDISPLILSSILENELEDGDNSVSDSMFTKRSPRGGYGFSKPRNRTKYVLFRPKPSNSPSLAALRYRMFRRRGNSIYFRYSDEVLSALRSLSNSPDRRENGRTRQSLSPESKFSSRSSSPNKRVAFSPSKSPTSSSPSSSPTLHNIDLGELLMHLARRRGGLDRLLQELEEAEEGNEFFLTKDIPKPFIPLGPIRERSSAQSVRSAKSNKNPSTNPLEQLNETDETDPRTSPIQDGEDVTEERKNVMFDLMPTVTEE